MGRPLLSDQCYDAAGGDGWRALALAVRITRLKLIAAGKLAPEFDEDLPVQVRKTAPPARESCEASSEVAVRGAEASPRRPSTLDLLERELLNRGVIRFA